MNTVIAPEQQQQLEQDSILNHDQVILWDDVTDEALEARINKNAGSGANSSC